MGIQTDGSRDALLIAMVLKELPSSFKTFSAIVVQQDKQMSFAEFKASLRSYELRRKREKPKRFE